MHLNHKLRRYAKLKEQLAELERDIKAHARREYPNQYPPPRIETLMQAIR